MLMLEEILTALLIGFVQIAIGFVFSIFAVYASLRLFDRLTGDIDEWKELKKGNMAIGLLFASIILSVALLVEPTIVSSVSLFSTRLPLSSFIFTFAFAAFNTIVATAFAIITIYIAIRALDLLTFGINEIAELKKGNAAVGL